MGSEAVAAGAGEAKAEAGAVPIGDIGESYPKGGIAKIKAV